MTDFRSRIRRLEERHRGGDADLLVELVRRANSEGSIAAAVESLEKERDGPLELDPFFLECAARIWRGTAAMVDALLRVAPTPPAAGS